MQATSRALVGLLLLLSSLVGSGNPARALEPGSGDAHADPVKVQTPAKASSDPAARVGWIRTEYATVQARVASGEWKRHALDPAPFGFQTTEGVSIEVYCEPPGQPRKLGVVFSGETGRSAVELFIADGEPFFGLKINTGYGRSFGDVVSTDEYRFYYDGPRVVRLIGPDGTVVDMPASGLLEDARELQSVAGRILRQPEICRR